MTDIVDPTQQTDVGYFKLNAVAMSLPHRSFGAIEFTEDGYYVIHDTKERISQIASILEGHGAFPCNDQGVFLDPAHGGGEPEPAQKPEVKETAKERKAREKAEAEAAKAAEAEAPAAPEAPAEPEAPAADEEI